jgi:Spy/CpxP family protein refolding chaperone
MMGGPGQMMEPEAAIMRLLGDKELGLTKEQREKLRTLMAGSTNAMRSLHARMKAAAKAQADLLLTEAPDEAAVLKGVEELGAVRLEMARLRMKQMLEARKILTPEQRTRLRDLLKERLEEARQRLEEGRKAMEKRREKLRDRQKGEGEPLPPPLPET